ncbi:hypothetical protein CKM354_000550000 [Cercospora kikuchii]|uniref:Mannan endo-1,6-alpha-mannosidase n=1 Tax=Cercospora kikuchii TaxID=84275 RepID=A0A9P3FGV9_9PEZI|nr:uncharacterized protein CKM354_000550000 [Cercospora kikuchii]GIZ42224.1 hypothetical protein CKM354_000550000 [Cercospora kikuchii]
MRVFKFASLLLAANFTSAIGLDLENEESIVSAGRTIVEHIFTIYKGNETGETPGLLPDPYYWWHAGLMFDSLINYWAVSGDEDLPGVISQGLLFQVGPDNNYMPPNQSKSLGNDDMAFWASAALTAAELGLPQSEDLPWLQLAETTFNTIAVRWDTETCGGGLKWQIFSFNNGYNYKNSVSTLAFAQLGARLARFTGNTTYSDWAERSLTWLQEVGLFELPSGQNSSEASETPDRVAIYDGTDDLANCSEINHIEWTQNDGLLLSTSAYAFNATGGTRTWSAYSFAGLVYANSFFAGSEDDDTRGIITEPACIPTENCNVDQIAFRALLARGLARTRDLTLNSNTTSSDGDSTTYDTINRILRTSAEAAARSCTGGESGNVCGLDWRSESFDGSEGIGQDLAALEVILGVLPRRRFATVNERVNNTGSGTQGNGSNAGGNNGTEGQAQGGENAGTGLRLPTFALAALMAGAVAVLL